jgi:hypothetical protein
MAKSKVDWDVIAREYIEARSDNVRPKLEDLAIKYEVTIAAIRKKCTRDRWIEKSRMFVQYLSKEINENKIAALADSLASLQVDFDSDCLNVAKKLIKQVNQVLTATEEEQREKPEQGIRSSDLTHYSNTLLSAQRVGRIALGSDNFTPDKIVNEALKLGFIVIDPRNNTSDTIKDGEGSSQKPIGAFADILREGADPAPPIAAEDQQ